MENYVEKITKLKQQKNAIILAHYYQNNDIQEIADYVGDSLGLAQKAAKTNADIIVFAGVYFMAETAKILNPGKKVLIPDKQAGCSLSDSCPPEKFEQFMRQHPNHYVISYINCSAKIKAMSDIICTSSNALRIVQSIPKKQAIVFAPDRNLGAYLNKITGRNMVLWNGTCIVHEAFSLEKIIQLRCKYPDSQIVAHPESEVQILAVANFIGSTSEMLEYVKSNPTNTFIVATEVGILHKMQNSVPHKTFIPAPIYDDNSCNCSECAFMKMNTLPKLYDCLLNESPAIELKEEVRKKALQPIQKMLAF
jgi:quinolinate synthase